MATQGTEITKESTFVLLVLFVAILNPTELVAIVLF